MGVPEPVTAAHGRWRRPGRPRTGQYVAARAPMLIDGLIDRAHSDWPETSFVLSLPSGEQVFVLPHRDGPPCVAGHSGYVSICVLPFSRVAPGRSGGRCRMTPVDSQGQPAPTPFYEIDVRSGMLILGARSPEPARFDPGSPHATE